MRVSCFIFLAFLLPLPIYSDAAELYQEGRKELKSGNFDNAVFAFSESYKLHKSSKTALALSFVYVKLNKPRDAIRWGKISYVAPPPLDIQDREILRKILTWSKAYIEQSRITRSVAFDFSQSNPGNALSKDIVANAAKKNREESSTPVPNIPEEYFDKDYYAELIFQSKLEDPCYDFYIDNMYNGTEYSAYQEYNQESYDNVYDDINECYTDTIAFPELEVELR